MDREYKMHFVPKCTLNSLSPKMPVYLLFQAYVVLGQFLILKKNKDLFIDWIKDLAGANNKQAADCYNCLYEWCDEFL